MVALKFLYQKIMSNTVCFTFGCSALTFFSLYQETGGDFLDTDLLFEERNVIFFKDCFFNLLFQIGMSHCSFFAVFATFISDNRLCNSVTMYYRTE